MSELLNPYVITASGEAPISPTPVGVEYSCRFNSVDSAYLSRTPVSAGNLKTWTFSAWVKDCSLSNQTYITDAADYCYLRLNGGTNNYPYFQNYKTSTAAVIANQNRATRDIAQWYHVVSVFDSTEAVNSDRMKIFINGVQVDSLNIANYPSLNFDGGYNDSVLHTIGSDYSLSVFSSCYMADVHFTDGIANTPLAFAETDFNGQWIPKEYTGNYGTNGYRLDFADSANLGNDVSGNNNDWTSHNLTSDDQMLDNPNNNYCTSIGDLTENGTKLVSVEEGGLRLTCGAYTAPSICSTMSVSLGKWYVEMKNIGANGVLGIINIDFGTTIAQYMGYDAYSWCFHQGNGYIYNNGSGSAYGNAYGINDIIGIALDMENGKAYFSINGVWQNSGDPVAQINPAIIGLTGNISISACGVGSANSTAYLNYGQDPNFANGYSDDNDEGTFAYTPPIDFLALCSNNLPSASVTPSDGFDIVTRAGTGASANISSLGFSPDLVVIKNRDQADNWNNVDSVRGATKELNWNNTITESTDANGLTSFDSNGYSLGTGADGYNDSGENFVDYSWLESSSYGMDIVSYTGNSTAGHTVAHNLGVVPEVMIVRCVTSGHAWAVYHKNLDVTSPQNYNLELSASDARITSSFTWNDTAPTSSVFTLGSGGDTNTNTETYIAYLFAGIEGFSKFGSYIGNGSDNGPFIELGFKPKMIMIKKYSGTALWMIVDSARNPYNEVNLTLLPNESYTESSIHLDLLSNGFKLREYGSAVNDTSSQYIYLAWSESPFKINRAV